MRIGFKKGRKERKKMKFNDTLYLHMSEIPNFKKPNHFPCISKFSRKKKEKDRKGEERREKDSFNEYCGKKKEKEKGKKKKSI